MTVEIGRLTISDQDGLKDAIATRDRVVIPKYERERRIMPANRTTEGLDYKDNRLLSNHAFDYALLVRIGVGSTLVISPKGYVLKSRGVSFPRSDRYAGTRELYFAPDAIAGCGSRTR